MRREGERGDGREERGEGRGEKGEGLREEVSSVSFGASDSPVQVLPAVLPALTYPGYTYKARCLVICPSRLWRELTRSV